ncbi:porin family protein [Flavobacterium sp. MFBS3-15]|uniref:porin family protein n=1 Tax=Flavobacterium sp. MFBS3-15 TaxID=2989816 RepID=UPI0022354B99|nr:porin family protein [Flavobacterium sp. MFBS3-15]MCW4470722.1 porin family protein [Flavobacterium sp. MFBS3-15]
MKQFIYIALMATSLTAFGQEWNMAPLEKNNENEKSAFDVKQEYIRLYLTAPGSFGDNVLAKANKGKIGAGLMVTFFSFSQKHHICGGIDFAAYTVEDVSLAGNVEQSNISNFYLAYMYRMPLGKKMSLNPKISVGSITIDQRKDGDSYGKQQGVGYGAGMDIDYAFTEHTRIFLGLNYTLLKPETHTIPELESFYDTLHQLNITFGVKF